MAVSCPGGAHAASLRPRATVPPAVAAPVPPAVPAPEPATRPEAPPPSDAGAPPHAPRQEARPTPPLVPAPPRGRASRRPGFHPQSAAVLLVAMVTGFAAWASLRARDERARLPAADRVVAVGGVSVAVPPDWRPAARPAGVVPGLKDPAAILEPYPGIRLYAVVTHAPHGIPPALRELTGALGPGRSALLAGRPALAYPARPIGGDRVAEVTVGRSSTGTLVVACIARSAARDLAAGCADQVRPVRGGR